DLSLWRESRAEWARAIVHRRQVAEIRARLDGAGHWRAIDARLELEEARRQPGRSEAQRRMLADAQRLDAEATQLSRGGEPARAIKLGRRVLEIRREVLGERHPHYVEAMNNLAVLYWEAGDARSAVPLFEQGLRLRKEQVGERHPEYATGLN